LANTFVPRKGIDILADIMQFMEPTASHRLLKNLQGSLPAVVKELRKRLFSFEDLAYGDSRGVQALIKLTTLRDLALSLKGAPEGVLQTLAQNMSQRAIEDLREEITQLGPRRISEIEEARKNIMTNAKRLVERRELFIQKGKATEGWID